MAINRYIVILLAFLCSFAIVGCDDYNDVDYPDTKLIKGQWQLVEDGDTDNQLIYKPKGRFFWSVVDKSRCRCFVL